jgi:hypothetical protein
MNDDNNNDKDLFRFLYVSQLTYAVVLLLFLAAIVYFAHN